MDKRFARGLSTVLVVCAGFVSTSCPTSTAAPARAAIPVGTAIPTVTNLGPASAVTSTSVAEQVGDRIWTITSGVSPPASTVRRTVPQLTPVRGARHSVWGLADRDLVQLPLP